ADVVAGESAGTERVIGRSIDSPAHELRPGLANVEAELADDAEIGLGRSARFRTLEGAAQLLLRGEDEAGATFDDAVEHAHLHALLRGGRGAEKGCHGGGEHESGFHGRIPLPIT